MTNVIKLFNGDVKASRLYDDLEKTLFESGNGLSIPVILGVIELLKIAVVNNAK